MHSLVDFAQSLVPLALGLLFLTVAVAGTSGAGWFFSGTKDVQIYSGTITGLHAGGDYRGLHMSVSATLSDHANLQGAKFDEAEMSFVDFRGADLSEASLRNAHLFNSILDGTTFIRADFTGASMSSARLREADLTGAVMESAWLTNADLTGAIVDNVDFTRAQLEGTILANAVLRGAVFFEASLIKTDLRGADLREANLDGLADFAGCSLFEARLEGNPYVSTEFLIYARGSGAILDNDQEASVRKALGENEEVEPAQFSLQDIRQEELRWRLDQAERTFTNSQPFTTEWRLAVLHLVEYSILANDLDRARELLNDAARSETRAEDGINGLYRWFVLVLDILTNDDQRRAQRLWDEWLEESSTELPDWDWGYWDEMLPVERYDKKQLLQINKLRDQLRRESRAEVRQYFQNIR